MIYIITMLVLLLVGFFVGGILERKHFRSIIEREERYSYLTVVASKNPQLDFECDTAFVSGSVVVAQDFFKHVWANFASLLGGRVRAYEPLLERARREAILRMKEKSAKLGARYIFNIKLATSPIQTNSKQKQGGAGCVEVVAYGTAIIPKR